MNWFLIQKILKNLLLIAIQKILSYKKIIGLLMQQKWSQQLRTSFFCSTKSSESQSEANSSEFSESEVISTFISTLSFLSSILSLRHKRFGYFKEDAISNFYTTLCTIILRMKNNVKILINLYEWKLIIKN